MKSHSECTQKYCTSNIKPKASRKDIQIWPEDNVSLLLPETVESLFYLYWFSGNKKYQNQGWKTLQCFSKYSRNSKYVCLGETLSMYVFSAAMDFTNMYLI